MNTTPSRIRWRIAPEKSDAEDRATGDSGCGNPAGDRPNDSVNGIFPPSHLGSAEAEAWHPDNLAKSGAQPRDDEIEACRIAAELARLHRDGAIASKSAHDLDAVFYARLLRDFGAAYTGREPGQELRPEAIHHPWQVSPRSGAANTLRHACLVEHGRPDRFPGYGQRKRGWGEPKSGRSILPLPLRELGFRKSESF